MKKQDKKEPVATLGQHLRMERELRGVELDEVSRVTRVRVAYLQNLEEDRIDELPADVYTRGYIRAYARFLGVDAERCITLYRRQTPDRGVSPVTAFTERAEGLTDGRPTRALPTLNEGFAEPMATPNSTGGMPAMGGGASSGRSRIGLALVIVTLLCAALLIAGVYYVNRSGEPPADAKNKPPAAQNDKNNDFFLDS